MSLFNRCILSWYYIINEYWGKSDDEEMCSDRNVWMLQDRMVCVKNA